MIIIPAIDLKDGKVVRYTQGHLNRKVYSSDPVKIALAWEKQGAKLLHLVDLDGAFTGIQKNLPQIKKIISALKIPVEVGGGIRDMLAVETVLSLGVFRVILGTKAIEDPEFLKNAIKKFGSKIALSVDAQSGKIGLYGWKKSTKFSLKTLLKNLEKIKLKTIIHTDISRDGTLSGVNIRGVKQILKNSNINLIASGGVATLEDIKKLNQLKSSQLIGVITGKALYENRFTLEEANDIIKVYKN